MYEFSYYAPLNSVLEEGERQCDSCGLVTDAGAYPDWVNGECETCDPDILTAEENIRNGETS